MGLTLPLGISQTGGAAGDFEERSKELARAGRGVLFRRRSPGSSGSHLLSSFRRLHMPAAKSVRWAPGSFRDFDLGCISLRRLRQALVQLPISNRRERSDEPEILTSAKAGLVKQPVGVISLL